MGSIFANSDLTLAASESKDCEDCFLRTRAPLRYHHCRLYEGCGLRYKVVVEDCKSGITPSLLDTRGWVYQKRLLSPRTVHFDLDLVRWECRTGWDCEVEHEDDECRHQLTFHAKACHSSRLFMVDPGEQQRCLSHWSQVMQNYAVTKLTKWTDRSMALAGLVNLITQQHQMTVSYGMWREFLIPELL